MRWRTALLAFAAMAMALCCASSQDSAAGERVKVRNLAQLGAFEVENIGPEIQLAYDVTVQREQGGAWIGVTTDLTLSEKCDGRPAGGCMRLERGGKLRPKLWNGLSCGSQCAAGCRANVYLGPGRFRIGVTSCNRSRTYFGAAFTLPAYTKK